MKSDEKNSISRILIVSGGNTPKAELLKKVHEESDYIIACDSGAAVLFDNNLRIDLILGDFDSIEPIYKKMMEKDKTITFKREKDFTDTEAAVRHAVTLNPERIVIVGATGTRIDHTLANITLLKMIKEKGIDGEIIDSNNHIYLIEKSTRIYKTTSFISFFAFTDNVEGFTLKGFKYPLDNHLLTFGSSLTVSNEILEEYGEVIFKEGCVLVMETWD